jgi:hypothetical protein
MARWRDERGKYCRGHGGDGGGRNGNGCLAWSTTCMCAYRGVGKRPRYDMKMQSLNEYSGELE